VVRIVTDPKADIYQAVAVVTAGKTSIDVPSPTVPSLVSLGVHRGIRDPFFFSGSTPDDKISG
jgi:hypothetical protein